MRNFDGKIHTACFVIILISISTFFLFSFGGPNMFSSLFFLSDMCKARGLSNEKNYYTFFPSSHF